MKVLLCPDSFKDALGAEEAAKAMAQGIQRAAPNAITQLCPLADGGEGRRQGTGHHEIGDL